MGNEIDARAQELANELRGVGEQERKRFLDTVLGDGLRRAVEQLLATDLKLNSTADTAEKSPKISTMAEGGFSDCAGNSVGTIR